MRRSCKGLQYKIGEAFPWCCVPLLRRTAVRVGCRAWRSFAQDAPMSAQTNRRLVFAETCRSRAAEICSPFRRKHLLVIAGLSDYEAELVMRSDERIAETNDLIARVEILLHRR